MDRKASIERNTKETRISACIDFENPEILEISTPLPFFNHLLHAMAFHGHFGLKIEAEGDIDVDPHHLVEDSGLVMGAALARIQAESSPLKRFGHFVLPMDDALSEAVIDAGGRPYLVYQADYPQPYAGHFDVALIREFLLALTTQGKITLHAHCRYGANSHHMAEALFKATGKALEIAFSPIGEKTGIQSTKGVI